MFTGIVKDIGMIRSIERRDGDARLNIEAPHLALSNFNLGDSVAVNGVCLTHFALPSFSNNLAITGLQGINGLPSLFNT